MAGTVTTDNAAKLETIDKILSANEGNEEAFPKTVVKGIWDRALKGSIAQSVCGSVPVALNGIAVPVPVSQPVAGVVGEAGEKPVTTLETKVKTMSPIKVAVIALYSMEAAKADPLGEYNRIQGELGEAVAKAIDTAVFTGKDALTGTEIPGVESFASASNTVEVDLSDRTAGYLANKITEAYDAVVLGEEEYDFTELLLTPHWRTALVNSVDAGGNRLYNSLNVNQRINDVMGLSTVFSRAIQGYAAAKTDSVLGYGGDFKDAMKFGYVENITFRRASERAGGIDLFDHNLGAILCEAQFGWIVRDAAALAKFTSPAD